MVVAAADRARASPALRLHHSSVVAPPGGGSTGHVGRVVGGRGGWKAAGPARFRRRTTGHPSVSRVDACAMHALPCPRLRVRQRQRHRRMSSNDACVDLTTTPVTFRQPSPTASRPARAGPDWRSAPARGDESVTIPPPTSNGLYAFFHRSRQQEERCRTRVAAPAAAREHTARPAQPRRRVPWVLRRLAARSSPAAGSGADAASTGG